MTSIWYMPVSYTHLDVYKRQVLIKTIILPALFASTMLSLINCLTEKNYVNQLSRLIRNAALIVTGLILAILSGIFSVQGLLTDTSDGLLINAARYSLSTFIPIVGGFTADTVELFLRCMRSVSYTHLDVYKRQPWSSVSRFCKAIILQAAVCSMMRLKI